MVARAPPFLRPDMPIYGVMSHVNTAHGFCNSFPLSIYKWYLALPLWGGISEAPPFPHPCMLTYRVLWHSLTHAPMHVPSTLKTINAISLKNICGWEDVKTERKAFGGPTTLPVTLHQCKVLVCAAILHNKSHSFTLLECCTISKGMGTF